jgi:hypothetical protein
VPYLEARRRARVGTTGGGGTLDHLSRDVSTYLGWRLRDQAFEGMITLAAAVAALEPDQMAWAVIQLGVRLEFFHDPQA